MSEIYGTKYNAFGMETTTERNYPTSFLNERVDKRRKSRLFQGETERPYETITDESIDQPTQITF
jgi:hypothetical protein